MTITLPRLMAGNGRHCPGCLRTGTAAPCLQPHEVARAARCEASKVRLRCKPCPIAQPPLASASGNNCGGVKLSVGGYTALSRSSSRSILSPRQLEVLTARRSELVRRLELVRCNSSAAELSALKATDSRNLDLQRDLHRGPSFSFGMSRSRVPTIDDNLRRESQRTQ